MVEDRRRALRVGIAVEDLGLVAENLVDVAASSLLRAAEAAVLRLVLAM